MQDRRIYVRYTQIAFEGDCEVLSGKGDMAFKLRAMGPDGVLSQIASQDTLTDPVVVGENEGNVCTCEDSAAGGLLQVGDNYTLNVTTNGSESSKTYIVNYERKVVRFRHGADTHMHHLAIAR